MAQKGVTLLELMIGLAVLGILVMMGLPNFSLWIQNTQIRTAAESVLAGIQLARAEAVRRNTVVSFTLTGNDWSVDVVNPAQNVQRRTNAEGSSNASIASTQNVIAYNGLGRITPVPAAAITFRVTNPNGGTCQGLAPGGTMRCLNVSVLSSGQVRLCDPALTLTAPTNPQSC